MHTGTGAGSPSLESDWCQESQNNQKEIQNDKCDLANLIMKNIKLE